MEGRHNLLNPNMVSGLPLIFFEQFYSSLIIKIAPTTLSVSSNNTCSSWGIPAMLCFFFSSSEHKEVSVVTLRTMLPSFVPCTPAISTWSDTSVHLSVLRDFEGHNTGNGMSLVATICERQQLPVRSSLSRRWIWGSQANTKAKHHWLNLGKNTSSRQL